MKIAAIVLASWFLSLGMVACQSGRQLERDAGGDESDATPAGTGGGATGGAIGTGGSSGRGSGGAAGAGGAIGTGGTVGVGGTPGVGGRTGGGGAGVGGMIALAVMTGSVSRDFPIQEVGVASAPVTWTISNDGGVATSALSLTDNSAGRLAVSNGCGTSLGAHSTCSIIVAFRPAALGVFAGTITLSAVSGGAVTFSATGTGGYRVTVTKAGTATGTVTSVPSGLSCGTTCSLVTASTSFTLQAGTTNGSAAFFSGWSGGGCSGPGRDCVVALTGSVNLTATFSPMTANLVFVTSETFPTNRGSAAAYDMNCNAVATAAGINDAGGTAYTAMTSDDASLARTRLGTARGWVRMDGRPFGDTASSLFTDGAVFNVIRFNENGIPQTQLSGSFAMTGTEYTGAVSLDNCGNWTSNSGAQVISGGSSEFGPGRWLGGSSSVCGGSFPILCLGHTRSTVVAPIVSTGKKIWLSNAVFMPGGGQTPDGACQATRPAGVTSAAAFIATTTRGAAAVLDQASNYVRPDGTLVASGSALAVGRDLESGIWQSGDRIYHGATTAEAPDVEAWIGQTSLASPGSIDSTCDNWTDRSRTGAIIGVFHSTVQPYWWNALAVGVSCDRIFDFLYCVEASP